jgi:hypothetical protein
MGGRRWLLLIAVGALLVGASIMGAAEKRDGVFVHISHGPDDPHRVLMGLQMARIMAED